MITIFIQEFGHCSIAGWVKRKPLPGVPRSSLWELHLLCRTLVWRFGVSFPSGVWTAPISPEALCRTAPGAMLMGHPEPMAWHLEPQPQSKQDPEVGVKIL